MAFPYTTYYKRASKSRSRRKPQQIVLTNHTTITSHRNIMKEEDIPWSHWEDKKKQEQEDRQKELIIQQERDKMKAYTLDRLYSIMKDKLK